MNRQAVRVAGIAIVAGAMAFACGGSTGSSSSSGGAGGAAGMVGYGGVGGTTADSGAPDVIEAGEPEVCDAMQAASWSGKTPWGNVDATVTRFGAGDCITISRAWIALETAGGDALQVGFSYPVGSTGAGRSVTGSLDEQAEVHFRPASGGDQTATAGVHVAVNTWLEHPSDPQGHEIDATLTFTDPGFGSAPIPLVGHFCRWDYLVC